MSRAEYMRNYRAKKRVLMPAVVERVRPGDPRWTPPPAESYVCSRDDGWFASLDELFTHRMTAHGDVFVISGHARIAELEAEVKHLKAELAKRPVVEEPITMPNGDAGHQWRRAPFEGFGAPRPAPKPTKHR